MAPGQGAAVGEAALVTLDLIAHTATVLLMQEVRESGGKMAFHPTLVVVLSETLKFLFCTSVTAMSRIRASRTGTPGPLRVEWRLILPAVLYCYTNNMGYVIVQLLRSSVLFVVFSSLDILVVGTLSVLILGRRLTWVQWASLLLLLNGVLGADLATCQNCESVSGLPILPMLLALLNSVVASTAGVLSEKFLKRSADAPLVEQSLALYAFGAFVAYGAHWASSSESHADSWSDLTSLPPSAYLLAVSNAISGLLTSLVMKRLSMIAKSFVGNSTLILSALLSIPLFHLSLPAPFFLAAADVCIATSLFRLGGAHGPPSPTLSPIRSMVKHATRGRSRSHSHSHSRSRRRSPTASLLQLAARSMRGEPGLQRYSYSAVGVRHRPEHLAEERGRWDSRSNSGTEGEEEGEEDDVEAGGTSALDESACSPPTTEDGSDAVSIGKAAL